jgi:uncharacterized protein
MEERIRLSFLMDYYGDLLTEKQKDVMNLYFNDDLSLAEISELTNTSRQAIHDIIRRCQKQLDGYESVLGMMEHSLHVEECKETLIGMLDKLPQEIDNSNTDKFIKDIRKFVIENL